MECHFKESADINDIRAFLDGYGTLQVDNEKVYTGYISNQIDWNKVLNFRKFIIQFRLQPIAKALTPTTVADRKLNVLISIINFTNKLVLRHFILLFIFYLSTYTMKRCSNN